MDLFHFDWATVPFRLIAFVIAFSVHEWAHAYVAWRLGDDTAKNQGRLTLNPIPHIDPFGLILILFGPFGWARPVPINPLNFRGNKRLGIVWVSAAGPFTNIVLAFLFGIIFYYTASHDTFGGMHEKVQIAIYETLRFSFIINVAMFIFNLLPISPLDGSKIFRYLAPRRWERFFYQLDIYGPWLLLMLIFLPPMRSIIDVPFAYAYKIMDDILSSIVLGM
ncbi:site-2 protease family protein [Brevibacillus dissolubilis]|uniref:site-2 protease family protein n=1 Tax=Brevibacillus dissolubilis TaxID=1844116 RepID=UPI001115BDEA|nr:site-2 protease family protein [Brevibacillus dissolubilis]